ncbi:EpsG family protein [Clostridium chrysemydis]|uniref:EpsG family protein n=1 Tax=Clostridium chrysemydis TaxID=2665504 RepID=UPI001883C58C|nr:EpsG family protein [Clostridium chrysemydis]
MTIYMINLVLVIISSILSEKALKSEHKNKKVYSFIFMSVGLLSLILVSGFRYKVGTDYSNYSEIYTAFGPDKVNWFESEFGFDFLMKSLYKISENPQIFFFLSSIIINTVIVIFLRKYSKDFSLSMYFYITTFVYYGTMNGLRQYLASVILISGFKHLLNRNFKKYFLFIIIASLFHQSALIFILIYFTANKKIESFTNIIIFGTFSLAFIFYQQFVDVLFNLIGTSQYSNYESIMHDTSNGANILRIAVWVIPIVIILLYKKRAMLVFGERLNVILNLCILGALFMCLAYRHVFFARFCMYFDVYYLLLLPKICSMFDEKNNKFFRIVMVSGYFLYSTMLLLSGESWIYPYKYNFNLF